MRPSLPILIVLLTTVAACDRAGNEAPSTNDRTGAESVANDTAMADAPGELRSPEGQASRESGPDIRPSDAPGVAFSYRYAFRLAAERVAEAQQQHQRLCERYGVSRCRIAGMTYRQANEDDVEAMLALRVDPAIAGQFGRESVQAVLAADGTLTDSEITGTDVSGDIQSAGRTIAELTARLEQIEARLRTARPADKGQLEYEAAGLRQQIRDLRSQREGQQRSLATTPILLRYGSGDLAPGPTPAPTLREALSDTGDDFAYSATMLLVILVRLLPWAVAALLIWGLVSFLRRRLSPRPAEAEPALGI